MSCQPPWIRRKSMEKVLHSRHPRTHLVEVFLHQSSKSPIDPSLDWCLLSSKSFPSRLIALYGPSHARSFLLSSSFTFTMSDHPDVAVATLASLAPAPRTLGLPPPLIIAQIEPFNMQGRVAFELMLDSMKDKSRERTTVRERQQYITWVTEAVPARDLDIE